MESSEQQKPNEKQNSPAKFLQRALFGTALGIILGIAGSATGNGEFASLLYFIAVIAAIVYDVRNKKFGIATGMIVGPVLLAFGILAILWTICAFSNVKF